MWQAIKNIFTLSGKEIHSFFSDTVLLRLVIIMFTVAIYIIASSITTEVKNAKVGIVDYDRSKPNRNTDGQWRLYFCAVYSSAI